MITGEKQKTPGFTGGFLFIMRLCVGDTGIEPVTSSVSGKRATAAPIAQILQALDISTSQAGGGYGIRTRVYGFAGRCLASRPIHRACKTVPAAPDHAWVTTKESRPFGRLNPSG